MKNKKVVYTIIGIISIVLIALAITYAYWQITKTQEGVNEITTACLDISLVDAEVGNMGVTLQEQFPLSDTEGETLKPYKFTVTNNCDSAVDYQIALESTGDFETTISGSSLKVMLDSKTSLLSSNETLTPTVSGAYSSYKLGMGTLSKSGDNGSSVTHELRLWVDEAAPVSENNKTYTGKISVTIGQGIESKNLKETILSQYGGESATTSLSDFNAITPGLYKTTDDIGTSYYYRGDITNNYIQFGTYNQNLTESIYKYVGCPHDGDDYACDENTFYETYDECYAATEEISGDFECESREIGTISVYKSGDPIYWRIIRINGDDTIRIIYYGPSINKEVDNFRTTIDAGEITMLNATAYSDLLKSGVDTWYYTHLNSKYNSYISDGTFCNDTSIYQNEEDNITYNAYNRLFESIAPTLNCSDTYKYTVANGKLTYPVGLITADEAVFAGLSYTGNSTSYLVGESSFTMTPTYESQDGEVTYSQIGTRLTHFTGGTDSTTNVIRPVINLKVDVEFEYEETEDGIGVYTILTD